VGYLISRSGPKLITQSLFNTLATLVYIPFLKSQIWKEITLELNGRPVSVTTFLMEFSFQYLFFGNLFLFLVMKIILKSICSTSKVHILWHKFHKILFTEIFPIIPHGHPNSSEIFQLWFNLIFNEDVFNIQLFLHNKSKCHEIKQVHLYLPKVFQRYPDLQLKHLYAPLLIQRYQDFELKHCNLGDFNVRNK